MGVKKHLLLLALVGLVLGLTNVSFTVAQDASSAPSVDLELNLGHTTRTDPTSYEREAESMSNQKSGKEVFSFQAEVSRMMDILIHSLYANKDIFLRELISNASDALDKIRFLSLTDKNILGEGETSNLEIKISLDKENNILIIRDRGIGMTKDELIKNLGTIARSGTSAFLEQLQKGGDVNLIGQFGVGFYSVYLVADRVEVVSKHNDDKQWLWSSDAQGVFSVEEDQGESLGRGTELRIHLKNEAQEYAEPAKLRELVKRYSEFVGFPIYLWEEQEAKTAAKTAAPADDDEDNEEHAAEVEGAIEGRWELLNGNKALWLRSPADVSEEEYNAFYRALSKSGADANAEPLAHVHFSAEGDVEFRALLFIPSQAPYGLYERYYDAAVREGVKLYVRRVFIADDGATGGGGVGLLPRYLAFLEGVVDSDTLPLNVSREVLQQEAALKTIRKKLIRKVLDLIKKLADDEEKCRDKQGDDQESDAACTKYTKFWGQYGKSVKMGIIEDTVNRNRLMNLLRFPSSRSEDGQLVSLRQYVARMKPGQKGIYYLAGTSEAELRQSPFLEQLLRRGYEVLLMTEVMDEYVMSYVHEYDTKKFQDASKDDLEIEEEDGKKDELKDEQEKQLKASFRGFTKWWKQELGGRVTSVRVSRRLTTSPCVVVAGRHGNSAHMERILRTQAFGGGGPVKPTQKLLEINPKHPLIQALKLRFESATGDEDLTAVARTAVLVYDTALLESGFVPEDVREFSRRIYDSLGTGLNVGDFEEVEEPAADAAEEGGEEAANPEEEEAAEEEEEEDASFSADDVHDEL